MLTKKQKLILDWTTARQRAAGYAPTLEEIRKHFRLRSVATVHQHIAALVAKGYLEKQKGQHRAIEITKSKSMTQVTLMGLIAAGGPIEAIRNPEPIEVPRSMLSRGANHYALRVQGTSMIEEGISDGDIVIVHEQPSVENGEKAVAYLPDKNAVTLKKIYREKNRIKLVPANKYMEPFYATSIKIQGRVVGVIRKEV